MHMWEPDPAQQVQNPPLLSDCFELVSQGSLKLGRCPACVTERAELRVPLLSSCCRATAGQLHGLTGFLNLHRASIFTAVEQGSILSCGLVRFQ